MTIDLRRAGRVTAVVLLAAALGLGGCKTTPPEETPKPRQEPTGPNAALLRLFPGAQDVSDWKPDGDAKVYAAAGTPEEGTQPLEAYAGPDASLLKGYDTVKVGVRKYARGGAGEALMLYVFEMKGPSEAFGLFSVTATWPRPQFPEVGQALAARMSGSDLGFVKGTYFVLAQVVGATEPTTALTEFMRWITEKITSAGYRPSVLQMFPMGSIEGDRYYLHTFDTLATLPFFPNTDRRALAQALDLGPQTDVAILGYRTETPDVTNYLFLVLYPNDATATAAYTAFVAYLDNSTSPADKNIAVAPPVGRYMAGTLNAEENSVQDQLAKLVKNLAG